MIKSPASKQDDQARRASISEMPQQGAIASFEDSRPQARAQGDLQHLMQTSPMIAQRMALSDALTTSGNQPVEGSAPIQCVRMQETEGQWARVADEGRDTKTDFTLSELVALYNEVSTQDNSGELLPLLLEDHPRLDTLAATIPQLDEEDSQAEATKTLNGLMLDEGIYSAVAADNELFAKMFVRIKDPDPNVREALVLSDNHGTNEQKKGQEIFSSRDQLLYLEQRLQALADDADYEEQEGTEIPMLLNQDTAKAALAATRAKLDALDLGQEVRLPIYSHRVGPMLGGYAHGGQGGARSAKSYYEQSAKNLNAILTSPDAIGANIRAQEADKGWGAYISTDSDTYYGPHGVAFDPRDVHQQDLSDDSSDNKRKHSSERRAGQEHQFRATQESIPFADSDGKPKVAGIFVGSHDEEQADLKGTLDPAHFTPGVLTMTLESASRELHREALELPAPDAHSGAGGRVQPQSAEEIYLMQKLLIELQGLYEPKAWAAKWKDTNEGKMIESLGGIAAQFQAALAARDALEGNDDDDSDDDNDWSDDDDY